MAKEIVWTLRAIQDRDNIYKFWSLHNQSDFYSEKLDLIFQGTATLLSKFPEIGTQIKVPGIRVKVVRTFKIFYRTNLETIEILRIWDSHQNPENIKII